MPTPIRDPNLPGDPAELRDIPDNQHPSPEWVTNVHNPVPTPPADAAPPIDPPVELPPPIDEKPPARAEHHAAAKKK